MIGTLSAMEPRITPRIGAGAALAGSNATDETAMAIDNEGSIMVCVRVRPINSKEAADEDNAVQPFQYNDNTIVDEDGGGGNRKPYTYDRVFGQSSTNAEVYDRCARRVVQAALRGYNGTVFAYGQTGSGKTHSMLGQGRDPGIVPRAVHDVFKYIEAASGGRNGGSTGDQPAAWPTEFLVRVSYLEVYNEEINDLLQPIQRNKGLNLKILRDDPSRGAIIEGLCEEIVSI